MFKTSFLIFLFIFLISCGKNGGQDSSQGKGGATVGLNEISTSAPVPSAALNFDVNVKMFNFDSTQEDKILAASELIKKVVATEAFKNKILNHVFNGKNTFANNAGLTNAQIYKKILEGSERLVPGINNAMDLELELYSDSTTVVGYTLPTTIRIWMNTKYFNANSAYKVTDNMMHEWLHKLGFEHDFASTPARPYSVPYAVGYIVRDLAKTMQ
jgi:hypothetical protein